MVHVSAIQASLVMGVKERHVQMPVVAMVSVAIPDYVYALMVTVVQVVMRNHVQASQ
jgi:hypothetical protein